MFHVPIEPVWDGGDSVPIGHRICLPPGWQCSRLQSSTLFFRAGSRPGRRASFSSPHEGTPAAALFWTIHRVCESTSHALPVLNQWTARSLDERLRERFSKMCAAAAICVYSVSDSLKTTAHYTVSSWTDPGTEPPDTHWEERRFLWDHQAQKINSKQIFTLAAVQQKNRKKNINENVIL